MKLIKMIGLAAVAAIAAMAFVGASSAAAEVLNESVICKVAPSAEHCPKGQAYNPASPFDIHGILKAGTKAVLEAGPIEDKCTESLVLIDEIKYGAHEIMGRIHELTFGGTCTCTKQVAIHLPWLGKAVANAAGGGTLLASTGGTGSPGGEVICSGNHCVYESADATGVTLTGGNPATATANVELSLNSGASDFFCVFSGASHWKAEYEILSPKPLFLALFLEL